MPEPVAPDGSKPTHRDTILIAGPGAIGLLTAARLQQAGLTVALLDHSPDRARRLASISLQEPQGGTSIPLTVTANPAVAADYPNILICVKAYATASVAQALGPYVGKSTTILSMQNGLGNREALQSLCCNRNIRLAVTSYGARLQSENTVIPTGDGIISIAATPQDPIAAQWQALLACAGFAVTLTSDTNAMLWRKLVLNAALNPVTACYRLLNGELPHHPAAWEQAVAILEESVRIANASGIHLDEPEMRKTLYAVCQSTAANQSSMLVDVLAGKPTEIDAINGAIVRAAQERELPATCNLAVLEQIRTKYPSAQARRKSE